MMGQKVNKNKVRFMAWLYIRLFAAKYWLISLCIFNVFVLFLFAFVL